MGLRHAVHRSTLAHANESRDWRIWSDIAALLIHRARKLYRDEDLGLNLSNTVYALDTTTIDLCLSLFDWWAPFRSTKAAIKMYTLLDLRGVIAIFIHVSNGAIFALSEVGWKWRASILALPYLTIWADVGAWWITKYEPAFAWIVVVSGALLGLALAAQIFITLWEMWLGRRLPTARMSG